MDSSAGRKSRDGGGHAERNEAWDRAFLIVLGEAIADLQTLIFDEGWDELVVSAGGTEAALRESVRHYERGLAHLFGFARAAGVPESPLAWSALKATLRRGMLDADQEITLRTALDSALYAAEQVPLGEHALYRRYVDVLHALLVGRTASAAPFMQNDTLEDRLDWGYSMLVDLEGHADFHAAVAKGVAEHAEDILSLEHRLLGLQRFDLILSTCLLWLAETGGCPDTR